MFTTTLLIISVLADIGVGGRALQHSRKLEKMLIDLQTEVRALKTRE